MIGATIYSAVDGKPKSTSALKRLANIRAHPRASLLVAHFSEDWDELWWVRADGAARVIEQGEEWVGAIDHLVAKYDQYAAMRPRAAVVAIDIDQWRSWSATATGPE
jgi:PPOX class probable F420-dependent enzyme